jgi:hypothetical protein
VTRRRRLGLGAALLGATLLGATAARDRGGPTLVLVDSTAIEARGLGRDALGRLAASPQAFTLRVTPNGSGDARPSVLARVETARGRARLVPRFPLVRGVPYEARLATGDAQPLVLRFALPDRRPAPSARVVAVHPSAARVPANLLRWYVELSAPMEPGDALRRVHLLDEAGREVPRAFLALDEELWDASRRRLTLLLDPGRVKRGIRTNLESGAPLVSGRRYRLVIDADWRDGRGAPLVSGFEHRFEAGDDDRAALDVARWVVAAPAAASRAPLRVSFGEPLDHALASRMLRVLDAAGRVVPGAATLLAGDSAWQFVPSASWAAGAYVLLADAALEDVAGNSLARVFDADRTMGAPPVERGTAEGTWREVQFTVRPTA